MSSTVFHDAVELGDVKVLPMSFTQQGLWFLDQLEPESAAYNISVAIRLRRLLDVEMLQRSLNAIVQRHEALRTTFRVMEGQPVQVIAPSLTIPLPVVDLRSPPVVEREAEALRLATEEARRPFDLMQGPLVRATFLHLGGEESMLLLTMHHIVSDEWSLGVLLRELATLYESFSTGRPSPLPELPIQYADFAVWQREVLQGDVLAEHLAYWKQQLAGSPAGLDLPTDRPRLPVPTSRGSTHSTTLPRALTDALKDLSQREGVTLYMTLVAAFQTLLYRYTGQEDLVIGTVTAGRTQAETEALIGLFANTLVLRTELSGNPTFRELLGRVREVIPEAQAHQDLPFEYLVKELRPTRSLGQNPLFQVSLTLEPHLPSLPPGWRLTPMEVETGTSKFDLSLELDDRAEGLIGRFEFSTDLFDAATIARLAGHWQTLLEGAVADPTWRMAELPLLTEKERHQLLVEWNDTAADYPTHRCLHQLFEAQVEETPGALAVVFEGEQLTYRELNSKANQLARYLQRLGMGPGILVGICVERSLEMVVGILGILKAGDAYVPLDPTYPPERLAFMLADTQAPVLLTQQQLVAKLPEYEGRVVCLDADWEEIERESEENLVSGVTAECLAYVIYTSGSTGKPKGVLVSHANVIRLFEATHAWFHFDNRDVWTLFHSYAFDFSVWELWGALLNGGRLVVVSYWVSRSPEAFYNLLRTERVTVLNQTPSAFYQLIRVEGSSGTAQDLALRLLIFGGEALEFQSLKPWFDRHGDRSPQLVNMYGITETTVHVTYYPLSAADLELTSGSVIGRPIPDLQLYILDQYRQLVPIGVPGEMYVGGAGLARGYLNRPELTAERFIPNPFSQKPDARLYKTGDLARYLPDDTIEFLGRIDHQVKIRGYRIELGEIEAVLNQHPAVHQAVVLAREDVPGDKRLVAYVVLHEDQSAMVDDLKSHLMKHVPTYMVPSAFVLLEALPLTPNGKVDRRALPAPEVGRRATRDGFVAPRLSVHHQLVRIWEELLGVRPIGIKDDFFELGGHSLLAAHMVDRIAQVCGKKLPLSTLFAGATIEHLASVLMGEDAQTDSRTPLVAVQAGGSKRPFFYLHGEWRGGAFYCHALAQALGADQPFYALEPYTFEGLRVPPPLETIAKLHLEALRSIQPEGPYLLGGWCNGALVAYEMARQLHTQGQAVDLLVLIDAPLPGRHRWIRSAISRLGGLLRLGQEKQFDWFLIVHHVYRYLRFARYRQLENAEQGKRGHRRSKGGFGLRRLAGLFTAAKDLRQDYPKALDWVAAGCAPGLYPGKITFFWASEEPGLSVEWREVVKAKEGEVEIYMIPGNDLTSRTEHLPALAERLRECVSKVQAAAMC